PLAARISLFRSLVNWGILFAVQWAFSLSENDPEAKTTISIAGEVMSALLDHDLNGVRNHITKQASAIERESKEGRLMGEQAEMLLRIMCRVLTQTRDLVLQCQIRDTLKTMLDVSPKDGPDMTPAGLNVKLLRPKDDPGTEKFLDYFYKRCIELLFKPFSDIPDFKNQTEPVLRLSHKKTNLYLYLCNLVCNFAQQHGFRIHFSMLSSQISARMASFLKAWDKHLHLSAFCFFRICLKVNNPNFMIHLMKLDVFKPMPPSVHAHSKAVFFHHRFVKAYPPLPTASHLTDKQLKYGHTLSDYNIQTALLIMQLMLSPMTSKPQCRITISWSPWW
ncbi:hypothetical protein EDB19DRAFT_1951949, partial [Suillus lakei]